MTYSLNIIFSTIGCIIGWGAFLAPETIFIPKIGIENSILGIIIGSFLICIISHTITKKSIFFLEWFLILGYLCISSLNLLNLTFIIQKYFNYIIPNSITILINSSIIILCYYFYYVNKNILEITYSIFSFLFFFLLLCVEIAIIYILYINGINLEKISVSTINFQQTVEMLSISPWLFIGFGYALNQKHKHKVSLAMIAILFSSFIYLSTILIVGTSPITSLWKITGHFFGLYGILFIFIAITFSIISGFIGFILLALDNNKQIYDKRNSKLFFLLLFSLTLTGRENLNLLIAIVSLAFSLMFTTHAYLYVKNKKTILSFLSFFCALLILISSFLPQNKNLYNRTTITILILWLFLGIFLRYNYKYKQKFLSS